VPTRQSIAVNTRFLIKNKLEGIGLFTYESLKRITKAHPEIDFYFLFDRPFDQEFIFGDNVKPVVLFPPARHPFLWYWWFEVSVKNWLKKNKPSLFLSTDGYACLGTDIPQVTVIHDLAFEHFKEHVPFLTLAYYQYYMPRFAKKATRIATVSEFSKKDIVDLYGVSPDKIDVVYNGIHGYFDVVSKDIKIATKTKYTKGADYFIFVGSLHPRKNILRLLKAFHLFKTETKSNFKLVLAGAIFWGENEMVELMKNLQIENEIVFTGRIANEELKNLIASAFALTYLPYFEGFGIPIVEAMQCGTPILAANTSCLPEIAGDAAIYANPFDENEIKHAMLTLYEDAEIRSNLIRKGLEQKNKYSWDKTANLLWQSIEHSL